MKEDIKKSIEKLRDRLIGLSDYICANPELGYEEHKSSRVLMDFLKEYGFNVEENFLNFPTAFRAVYQGEKPGPTICYLAEYDALPDIGHGCGHNMIGTAGVGAGVVLKEYIDEIGGKIIVLGTPAEETSGAKVNMVNEGVFDNVDVAMMVHPSDYSYMSGSSLAMCQLEITYYGKPAHAASMPEEGINALDACIQTFNGINAIREHIKDSSRIHGIITEGGTAVNVVPEKAVASFSIRSVETDYRQVLKDKVITIAKAAGEMMGARVEIDDSGNPYDAMETNETLSKVFTKNLVDIGIDDLQEGKDQSGSLDMGNVSKVCPSIHSYFGIFGQGEKHPGHSEGFRDATMTEYAYNNMLKSIYALVATGIDVIRDKDLLSEIKKEFEANK